MFLRKEPRRATTSIMQPRQTLSLNLITNKIKCEAQHINITQNQQRVKHCLSLDSILWVMHGSWQQFECFLSLRNINLDNLDYHCIYCRDRFWLCIITMKHQHIADFPSIVKVICEIGSWLYSNLDLLITTWTHVFLT